MLQLWPGRVIPTDDLEYDAVRSSGPGGQNVNKVATKVVLRFRLESTVALTLGQKRRLAEAFPSHVTLAGEFVLSSDRFRSRERNQRDVEQRLVEMVSSIRYPPKRRVASRPTRAAKARRLADKRTRSGVKQGRKKPAHEA